MKFNKMFLIIGVIVFCLIGVFIVYNEKKKKIERSLDKIPFTAINKLQQNKYSKIKGKVLSGSKALISPLSEKKCVYYAIKIEEEKVSGKNHYWNTIYKDEKIQDFYVEDNGDFIIVNAKTYPKNFKSYITSKEIISENEDCYSWNS